MKVLHHTPQKTTLCVLMSRTKVIENNIIKVKTKEGKRAKQQQEVEINQHSTTNQLLKAKNKVKPLI